MSLLAFFVLLLLLLAPSRAQQSISDYWVGDWQVTANPQCDISSCCCFSNSVNIFAEDTGELYLNGTVVGDTCNGPVKEDNVDPPQSFTVTEEFFGIDDYTFTIANATNGLGLAITAIDNSAMIPRCSFQLYRATTHLLPNASTFTNPPHFPALPSFAFPYIGMWQFDNTCAAAAPSCCCLTGSVAIYPDPDLSPSFYIRGPASAGCRLAGGMEQDDFPWPSSGSDSSSSINLVGFLVNSDQYNVSLNQERDGSYTLSFQDLTSPACSMRATRTPPGQSPSQGTCHAAIGLTVLVTLGAVLLLGLFVYLFMRWRRAQAPYRAVG